jgi:hypothetical protein
MSIKKNRIDQRGAAGSVVTAKGYTIKARPGPKHQALLLHKTLTKESHLGRPHLQRFVQ